MLSHNACTAVDTIILRSIGSLVLTDIAVVLCNLIFYREPKRKEKNDASVFEFYHHSLLFLTSPYTQQELYYKFQQFTIVKQVSSYSRNDQDDKETLTNIFWSIIGSITSIIFFLRFVVHVQYLHILRYILCVPPCCQRNIRDFVELIY